jgi:hypothetical protein
VSLAYGRWTVDHALPVGATERAEVGAHLNAGDVIAAGSVFGTALRVGGARRLGLSPEALAQDLRVPVGAEVAARTIVARTGRRLVRAVSAPIDGRLIQIGADGDLYFAPVVGRWVARSALDGVVTRSDDARVSLEGEAWSLQGVAAYGPDAAGELTLGIASAADELAPAKLDVRLGGRIMIGGARVSAETITRAHACGIAALVAGGANAAGLRLVFGEQLRAGGAPTREDRPTVLCLFGFGTTRLPEGLFDALARFSGARAAIHTASARLFVFAPPDGPSAAVSAGLALANDYSAVRVLDAACEPAGETSFQSGVRAQALRCGGEVFASANVSWFGPQR